MGGRGQILLIVSDLRIVGTVIERAGVSSRNVHFETPFQDGAGRGLPDEDVQCDPKGTA